MIESTKTRIALILTASSILAAAPQPSTAAQPLTQTLTSKLQWRNVGPFIGGRVVAVAGVPGRDVFYMGGVDAGVWKSTDYGIAWTNLTDGKAFGESDSIGALAVAPSNANIVYAGTGESDIRGDFITGDGVYKTTDAGKTWRYAGLRDTHTISSIVVDPRDDQVVYASSMGHVFAPNADRGVFKSTDGGATWHKSLYVDDKTGVIALAMDPKDPDVLYAAAWQAFRDAWSLGSGGPGSGLYKTTDGGAHWTNISRAPGFPQGILGRIGVSIAASDPQVVYAIAQATSGGIFRSADGGASWQHVNDDWAFRQRAFYYMSIFADPANANTVYVVEVDALWVSHDGGRTFAKLHTPHGDNHIVWIDPKNPDVLLEGNDGGATVSTDGGVTWSTEHNQPTGQFYHIDIDDRFPFHMFGAQQDEGSIEGPSASSGGAISDADWHDTAYGESTFVVPQPDNPDVAFGSGYYTIFLRYDMATEEYESVSPWPDYQEGAPARELEYRFGWTHPILFSPSNPKELLVGSQYVLASTDDGQTWRRISPDLTRDDPKTEAPTGGPIDLDESGAETYPDVESLAVSPLAADEIWAGSADGLVHVTTDGGAHWESVTPPALKPWAEITSIEPSHVEKGTAYVTASRYMWDDFHPYIYKTVDDGRHWTAITGGMPADDYVFVVRQDPHDASLLFAGTKNTVFVSFDGGAAWEPLTLDLPHVQVRDIAIDARQGDVAIATHGRSFWVLDDLAFLEQLTNPSVSDAAGARLFAPETAWLTHAYGASDFSRATSGIDPPFGATVYFELPQSYDGRQPVSVSFTDAQGRVVRSFDLHPRSKKPMPSQKTRDNWSPAQRKAFAHEQLTAVQKGMNRFQWDLRMPDATEVRGFYVPVAAGGLPDEVVGPVVVPGTYGVVLDYNGAKTGQTFQVALDPRLQVSPDALGARFELLSQIHASLDALDKTLDGALDVRDGLTKAVARNRVAASRAQPALHALNGEIGELVQLDIQSSEGDLLHEAKLRDRLAFIAADVDLAYARPTAAQYAVFAELDAKAKAGENRLARAIASAQRLMR